MTDEPSSVQEAIDEALSDLGPAVPPLPYIKTRVSTLHLVLGNTILFLLVLGLLLDWTAWWILVVLATIVAYPLAWADPTQKNLKQFQDARLADIRPAFPDDASAREFVEKERPASLTTPPSRDLIAIPMLLLTFVVPVTVFLEINAYVADWHWLLRLPLAALVGAFCWALAIFLWAASNLTPEAIPPDALERVEPASYELGHEDENDMQIIRQMVNLESLSKRIDTYTLEGALLSALSFSSFISLIVSERDFLEQLRTLFHSAFLWKNPGPGTLLSPVRAVGQYPDLWQFAMGHLIPLIGLSMLLCASTFLGVLVARLRFNEGYRDAESCIKIAAKFNDKEDQAIHNKDSAKAAFYASAISRLLRSADECETGLAIIVTHMKISRNAGIVFFIFTLILCGMFFDPYIAGLVAMFFVAAWLVGYADRFARRLLRQKVFSHAILGPLSKPFRHGRGRDSG